MSLPKGIRIALRWLWVAVVVVLFGAVALPLARFYIPDDWALLGSVQRLLGVNRQSYRNELAGKVAAHRGYDGADNTERSIRNAIKNGATIVEIDVRWCGDEWILFHDATTENLKWGLKSNVSSPKLDG